VNIVQKVSLSGQRAISISSRSSITRILNHVLPANFHERWTDSQRIPRRLSHRGGIHLQHRHSRNIVIPAKEKVVPGLENPGRSDCSDPASTVAASPQSAVDLVPGPCGAPGRDEFYSSSLFTSLRGNSWRPPRGSIRDERHCMTICAYRTLVNQPPGTRFDASLVTPFQAWSRFYRITQGMGKGLGWKQGGLGDSKGKGDLFCLSNGNNSYFNA